MLDHQPAGGDPGLTDRPVEDRGHETARWYAYQYALTAQECLMMLVTPRPWIICEWHADFVCAGPDGGHPHCLVSVKHRSADQGPWALADLPKRGGFKVLYERWAASGYFHTCRWVTNGGLKPGDDQVKELARLLALPITADREQRISQYAGLLSEGIGAAISDAESFLGSLQMISTGGDEFSMRAQAIEGVARPVMQHLGVAAGMARVAFLAAYDLVTEAVLNLNPDEPDGLWMTPTDPASEDRAKRTISRHRLLERLRERGIAIPNDAGIAGAPGESDMIRKLRAGRLGPTVIASAPRLRRRWYELEATFRPDVPSPLQDEVNRLRAEVLYRASMAETRTRRPGAAYGVSMHGALTELLTHEISARLPISAPELMGCIYQLTDECEVWWSDRFNPQYDAPWLLEPKVQSYVQPSLLQMDADSAEASA